MSQNKEVQFTLDGRPSSSPPSNTSFTTLAKCPNIWALLRTFYLNPSQNGLGVKQLRVHFRYDATMPDKEFMSFRTIQRHLSELILQEYITLAAHRVGYNNLEKRWIITQKGIDAYEQN